MTFSMTLFIALLLFFYGLKLSAFFSGSETGFYRVSTLQLTLEKQRGDQVASRLFHFVAHPERFVATTLVGNNVANYLTTLAIGLVVSTLWNHTAGGPEIVATMLLTPVVFIFGELIPKILYYRAPMSLLRSGAVSFRFFYFLFLPISYPLILLTRLVARLGSSEKRPLEVVFGRNRLYGVLEAGQREGLLTEIQRNLAENLMQVANLAVEHSVWPASTVQGVSETASIEEVLTLAEGSDSGFVLVHAEGRPSEWTSVLRVADMLASGLAPRLIMQPLPEFEASTPRLEVLTQLFREYSTFGVVKRDGRVLGIIHRQTLVSDLFRVIRPASSQLPSLLTPGPP
ncbi:MAG: CNNM domain-containing protein [Fuerstiella sp.]